MATVERQMCSNRHLLVASALIVSLASFAEPVNSEERAPLPLEVNVTSDSTPGWLPSIEQIHAVEGEAAQYWAARDYGLFDDAYRRLADINKANQSLSTYSSQMKEFYAKLGTRIERRIVKVTWTKDSPQAPLPGIYAAVDFVARFSNADRYCGYAVLYQPTAGDAFKVMREEDNVLDNSTAQSIERQRSKAELDGLWAQLSSNCPNYPGVAPQP